MAIPTPNTPNYDPDLPVYAEPETQFTDIGVEQKPIDSYVDPAQSTVEGRTTALLQNGSPLLEMARADSKRGFLSRGLLNEGQAVSAGTQATIREAREIATPDALLYGGMAQAQQKTDSDAAINNQVAGLENQKNINNARLGASLTTHEQYGNVELQKLSDNAQLQRVEVDNQWKSMINFDQMSAQDRTSLLGVSQTVGAELTGGIERVLRDTNISNKTEAIEALVTSYKSQLTTAASIVNLNLTWN
jgi:hypothetical protein